MKWFVRMSLLSCAWILVFFFCLLVATGPRGFTWSTEFTESHEIFYEREYFVKIFQLNLMLLSTHEFRINSCNLTNFVFLVSKTPRYNENKIGFSFNFLFSLPYLTKKKIRFFLFFFHFSFSFVFESVDCLFVTKFVCRSRND